MIKELTCIECPIGCNVSVTVENGKILKIEGNSCPRGKAYAESEVTMPVRVITSTARTTDGRLVSVKTDKPAKKDDTFLVLKIINSLKVQTPVRIGDILYENVSNGANIVATSNLD